jgi:hypothetical protein
MKYRLATVLARESHSSDTTKVIDLNLADPVSQMHITYEGVNASGGAATAHPAKCITKIELVDGSDVLYSLSGQEAHAADWYHRGKEPTHELGYLNGMSSVMTYNMNFGRFLWDPLLAFDPRKFKNPQLKVTIDINGGGQAPASGYLTVLANIFDQKTVDPMGFLMHKEIKDYALASAAHEYTDLPTDFPYRKLFVRAQVYGSGPEYVINTIKLSEENDRKIPFNLTAYEHLRALAAIHGPYREKILMPGGATPEVFYCTPCYYVIPNLSPWETSTNAFNWSARGGSGGRGYVYLSAGGINLALNVEGWAPHGVLEFPFGIQDDPDDWYDVSALGSLTLDILSISGMSSSESIQVFLQQLRKY